MTVLDRMKALSIVLPRPNPPAAVYCPGILDGRMIYTAGQTPKVDGKLQYVGKLGSDLQVKDGQAAARLCALNCLSIIAELSGGLDHVARIVKMTGYVNSTAEFTQQSQVIDGASQLLYDLFGEIGAHARSAIGCSSLPGNACCEIELVVSLK